MTRKPQATVPSPPEAEPGSRTLHSATWKLEDAKAKFSEVVRRARDQGPQYVTVRGKPTVAIVDIIELQRLSPLPKSVPLVDFLESLQLDGLDLTRDHDIGRDPKL